MYKVLIVDDEPLATGIVQEYLADFPDFVVVKVCHDGFEGLKALQAEKPDLMFLDVQMPKLNGFEMLELVEAPPAVIFTTAYDQYALKAFDAHAVDYLLKPFSQSRFAQSISRFLRMGQTSALKEMLENENPNHPDACQRIVLKDKNEIKIIPVPDVKYLQANDDYVNIFSRDGKFLKNKTLTYFENTLPADSFVRVHRSYIVNVAEITKIEPYEKEGYLLKLKGGEAVPVSKTGYPKLKAILGI